MLREYEPINYSTWNFDGQGHNILDNRLLSPDEKKVWEAALPFQDSREGETGHGEAVTYFALKLLEKYSMDMHGNIPNTGVVTRATILHDIGWSQLTESERKLFYEEAIDPSIEKPVWQRYEPILRARHQEMGVVKAREILKQVNYNPENTKQILEIISQHDTRESFRDANDGLVRDADKLWRYTLAHARMVSETRGWSVDRQREIMEEAIDKKGFFYSKYAKEIARVEMGNCLEWLGRD
ncbi:hypothetical protein ACFL0X_01180 [Nanoarchaeota archaeon]